MLGNGNGTFDPPNSFPTGLEPYGVAIGDLNRDGDLDLATANLGGSSVSVLLGNGDGSFAPETPFVVGTIPHDVVIADFNKDGNLDLVSVNNGTHDVSVLAGFGNGNFGLVGNFPAGTGADALTKGDFNRDGNLDLAVTNNNLGNVSILLGVGNGTFGGPTNFAAGAGNPRSVATGDFNDDGKLDLAVANSVGSTVSVLMGRGNGLFGGPTNLPVGANPQSVAIGDFNRDGDLDFVVTHAGGGANSVGTFLGQGDGSFLPRVNFGVGMGPNWVAVGDVNGDGKPDIATANPPSQNVSILLNDGKPGASLDPESLRFIPHNGPSRPPEEITLRNMGEAPMEVVEHPDRWRQRWRLQNRSGRLLGRVLLVDESCGISVVVFLPTADGERNAMLRVTTNAPTSPDFVPLEGTGDLTDPDIQITSGPAMDRSSAIRRLLGSSTPVTRRQRSSARWTTVPVACDSPSFTVVRTQPGRAPL